MTLTLKPPENEGEVAILCIEAKANDLAQIPKEQVMRTFSQELDKIWPQIEELQTILT